MEPTNLRLGTSHRGGATWRITVQGRSGMAFSNEALSNPVWCLGRALAEIEKLSAARKIEGDAMAVEVFHLHAGTDWPIGDRVPAKASMMVWGETRPDEDPDALEECLKERLRRVDLGHIEIARVIFLMAGSRIPLVHVAVRWLQTDDGPARVI